MSRLSTNLFQTIKQQGLFSRGDVLVVAVSGGADSIALLHLLAGLEERLGVRLYAVTLDHALRDNSESDVDLVVHFCEMLNIPVFQKRVDVKQEARVQGIGIELAGRRARYDYFRTVALEVGAGKVVTAHHLDDQAETVLMHLLRGSGLRGVSGMKTTSVFPGAAYLQLIRPLLHMPGEWLREYCIENNLTFHDDPSNESGEWLRNRIRNQILPLLADVVNPGTRHALARFAESSALDESLLMDVVSDQIEGHYVVSETEIRINRQEFSHWHEAIQRHALLLLMRKYLQVAEPSYEQIIHAVKLGVSGSVGNVAQFSGNCQMRVDYSDLVLETATAQLKTMEGQYLLPEAGVVRLNCPGKTTVPGMGWSVCLTLDGSSEVGTHRIDVPDLKSLNHLVLRSRLAGERFRLPGLKGHSKKIKDWMIDNKIPRAIRDRVPILADQQQALAILWNQVWICSQQDKRNHNETSIVMISLCSE